MLQVGDGVKKWAVLLPTAVLPRPWRVAVRKEGLARLEVGKAQRTGLLIIGHPKSGNTWLKVMLSRLYQVRHGIPASVIVTSDELARRNPAIPRISATNGHYSYEGAVGRLLAPDAPIPRSATSPSCCWREIPAISPCPGSSSSPSASRPTSRS